MDLQVLVKLTSTAICYHTLNSSDFNVVCLALTGIAATLLPEGRIIHSVFKIPIHLTDTSTSYLDANIDPRSLQLR